jgi:hypothetical protein
MKEGGGKEGRTWTRKEGKNGVNCRMKEAKEGKKF